MADNDSEKSSLLAEAGMANFRYNAATIEVNLKGWGLFEDTEFLKSLRECGYNYVRPEKDYPFPCIVAIDRAIAARCLPHKNESDAGLEMGRKFFEALSLSVIGRIMKAPLKISNLERGLNTMVANFNQNAGFGKREVVKIADKHYQIISSNDPAGTEVITRYVWLGIYQRLLESFGINNVKGAVCQTGPLSFTVDLYWD